VPVRQTLTEYTQGVATTYYYDTDVQYIMGSLTNSGTINIDNEIYIALAEILEDATSDITNELFVSASGSVGSDVRNIVDDFFVGVVPSGVYGGTDIDAEYIEGHIVSPAGTGEDVDVNYIEGNIYDIDVDQYIEWAIATSNLQSGEPAYGYPISSFLYDTDSFGSTFPASFTILYSQLITIDGNKIEDDLTDFPVALRIDDASNKIFEHALDSGADIKFKHNSSWLKHELVNFDKSNHELLAYVKCTLTSGTDYSFYVYYGDVNYLEDKYNTWESDYKIVYHFQEAPPGDILNSAISGTNDALPISMESGDSVDDVFLGTKILRFDGNSEYLAVRDFNYNTPGELPEITVEAILKTDSTSEYRMIASWDRSSVFRFTVGDDALGGYYGYVGWDTTDEDDVLHDMQSNNTVNDNSFHYIAVTYTSDGGTKRIFIDGDIDKETVAAHTDGNALVESAGSELPRYGFIGVGSEAGSFNGLTGPNSYFEGDMAEFRLTHVARSEGWIKTTYNNLMDLDNFFVTVGGDERRYIMGGISVSGSISADISTVSGTTGGYLWGIPDDVYISLCNTVPSGLVYKPISGVYPVTSDSYFTTDAFASVSGTRFSLDTDVAVSGSLTGYPQDVFASILVMTTVSGGGIDADIRLHALEIDNFFLDVDEYTTNEAIAHVDIYDKRDIAIDTSNSYFVVSGTQVPVTFNSISVNTTDLGMPITVSGYRMYFDPPADFASDEPIEIIAHAANTVGDILEKTYYLLYGYNLIYDIPPEVTWDWDSQIIVWATAKNKASCPQSSTDAWWFQTRPKEHADLGATIVPIGFEGSNLPATIYPQLSSSKTFFYGAKVKITVRAKDEAGNEMEPFVLDFTIEDKPN
jgi:hypothetical protein